MSLCLNCFVSRLIAHELVHEQIFFLGSACLLNESKTKAQAWLIYKQTNMNKFFIELNSSCSWSAWFIYNPIKHYQESHNSWQNLLPNIRLCAPRDILHQIALDRGVHATHRPTHPNRTQSISTRPDYSVVSCGS